MGGEAKLAREAGICYVTIALSTDYDCWRRDTAAVTADAVLAIIHKNIELAQTILKEVVANIGDKKDCQCGEAAKHAIVTDRTKIPAAVKRDLEPLFGAYL